MLIKTLGKSRCSFDSFKNSPKIEFWYLWEFFMLNGCWNLSSSIMEGQKTAEIFVCAYRCLTEKKSFLTYNYLILKNSFKIWFFFEAFSQVKETLLHENSLWIKVEGGFELFFFLHIPIAQISRYLTMTKNTSDSGEILSESSFRA